MLREELGVLDLLLVQTPAMANPHAGQEPFRI